MTTQWVSGTPGTVTVGSCPALPSASMVVLGGVVVVVESGHSVSPLCEVHAEQFN